MDRRRLTGGIALAALAAVLIALVWFDARLTRQEPTTALAPVSSGDQTAPTADATAPAAAPDAQTAANPPAEAPAPTPDAQTAANAPAEAPAATPPAAEAPAATPDTQVASNPPASDTTAAPPPAAMPGPAVVPTFDVVRVEPSGDSVIAGLADPGSKVEVLDGQETIATAEANEHGEWALNLDKPLAAGTHDLAIRTTSKDAKVAMLSDQRVAVSVPTPGSKDVLVVMNSPNGASKVLEVPNAEGQVASAAPEAGAAPATPPAAGVATAETPPAAAPEATAPATSTAEAPAAAEPGTTAPATSTAEAPAAAQPEVTAPAIATAEAPAATQPEAPTAGETTVASAPPAEAPATELAPPATDGVVAAKEPPPASEPQIVAEAPVPTEPAPAAEPPVATEAPVQVAKAPPADQPAVPTPAPPKPEVAIAAVEADTSGNLYIAGTVTTGDTVRVYVDDKPIGDAEPSPSGTWLVETKRDLPAGTYKVRVDQVDNGGNVIARSEVPYEREVEVAILKPTGTVGTSESGATVTGTMPAMETVIIKRRDNLWRIARRAWGKGVRWSTIYQANTDQIRDPHWIYPGQVFIMPKGNATWTD
jgi:LysM domain